MSATSTMLRLATAVSENAGPNSTEFALAEAVINYLHRPIGLHPELRRVRDRLAQRLYSPAAERDLTTLLDLLTDKLALLESSAKVQPDATPDDQVQPDWTSPSPDEWNRTHLRQEMQRVAHNLAKWATDQPLYGWRERISEDMRSLLSALARADNVIHAQAADLAHLRSHLPEAWQTRPPQAGVEHYEETLRKLPSAEDRLTWLLGNLPKQTSALEVSVPVWVLQNALSSLEESYQAAKAEAHLADEFKRERDEARARVAELEAEATKWKNEYAATEASRKYAFERHEAILQERKCAEKECDFLRSELENLRLLVDDFLDRVRLAADAHTSEPGAIVGVVGALRNNLADAMAELKGQRAEVDRLMAQLHAIRSAVAELEVVAGMR